MVVSLRCTLGLTLLMFSPPLLGQAVVLYDNGPPNYLAAFGVQGSALADDFELSFGSVATRAAFVLLDNDCQFPANWDGIAQWWIYTDDGVGLPSALVATGFAPRVSWTAEVPSGWCPFQVSFPFGETVQLQANVRYWFALHFSGTWGVGGPLSMAGSLSWYYGFYAARSSPIAPWSSGVDHLAFSIQASSDDSYLFTDGFEISDTSLWSHAQPDP